VVCGISSDSLLPGFPLQIQKAGDEKVLHTPRRARQPSASVHLEKFYIDVVAADGSGCIGYAARLDGFGLAATLAASLRWDAGPSRAPVQQRTLRGTLPVADCAGLAWRCPALTLTGTWAAIDPPGPEITLWSDASGSVRWQPLAARAKVALEADGRSFAGWGYAERLRLDLPPWRLPIDGLTWGRFVAPTQSAVWIEWEHATPRRWLWHNGAACSRVAISRTGVQWSGGAIAFGPPRSLRRGRLAETAFARWPGVRRWLPKPILALNESKWCAPATLTGADRVGTPGWVIHEHVRFS
jgi:hypothetical protein